eukprot:CAMPEP_0194283080 /NCGR_PEP_ID=MMETSP0169-20130528/24619_1 /TAXON_ID=218684 /ORGANISM="Corethron pennatum, Strain L29A3" /LENGTH=687 /DNA_ID=CAMNT_0039028607 /DNA_START=165 /DNA_END=2228 /DNA_ORIENTATION=+
MMRIPSRPRRKAGSTAGCALLLCAALRPAPVADALVLPLCRAFLQQRPLPPSTQRRWPLMALGSVTSELDVGTRPSPPSRRLQRRPPPPPPPPPSGVPTKRANARYTESVAAPRVPFANNANYVRPSIGESANAGTGVVFDHPGASPLPGIGASIADVQGANDDATAARGEAQRAMIEEFEKMSTDGWSEAAAQIEIEIDAVPRKRRGRPPKSEARGEQLGAGVATIAAPSSASAPKTDGSVATGDGAPKKRGRGRPKGSKGKKTLLLEARMKQRRREAGVPEDEPLKGSSNKDLYQGRTSENTRALQTFYKADLLKRDEEITLGTVVQTMVRFETSHERLLLRLMRLPTLEEWAHDCGYTVAYDGDITYEVGEEEDLALRPVGTLPNEILEIRCKEFNSTMDAAISDSPLPVGEACQGSVRDFVDFIVEAKAAKRTMVESNMRLVISIARKYSNVGVNLQDLVQEGSLGLMRAAEKYDPSRGFRFSTYASWWIQQAVFRAIAYHSRTIRLPVHIHNLLNKARKTRNGLLTRNGRAPTDPEIAHEMGIEPAKLVKLLRLTRRSISLELPKFRKTGPKGDPGDAPTTLGDTIDTEAGGETTPQKGLDHALFHDDLRKMLTKVLNQDEVSVIRLRYGLDDGMTRTVTAVSEILKQDRSWVRSLECRALRKLRRPWYEKRLREHQDSLDN